MDDENTVVVDLTGLKDEFTDLKKSLKGLEESLVKKPQMESANETIPAASISFDYKKGIAGMLANDHGGTRAGAPIHEGLHSSEEVPDYINKDEKGHYYLQETQTLTETIGTLDPDCCVPEVWADDIQLTHVYGKSIFWQAWFMNWDQGIYQKPGDTVYWCKIPPISAGTLACTEPTITEPDMTCPSCSLTGRVCALTLCVDDIEDAQTGLVDAVNEAIGNCLSVAIDEYFINVALSCTNLGTLTDSGAMTGSLLIEAMGTMQMANRSKWKQLYVSTHITNPCEHKALLNKQCVPTVGTLGCQVPSKERHNVLIVENISSLTRNEHLSIVKNGERTTLRNGKHRNIEEMFQTQKSIETCEKKEATYVTSVNFPMIDREHLNSMNGVENLIGATQHSLDNIQNGLSYFANDATMPLIGLWINLGGITKNSKLMYPHFSEPNLQPGEARMQLGAVQVADAGH